jgi:sugar phosphate isomerase/epimerase
MVLSCCAWALTQPEPDALRLLHDLGLKAIDIRPSWLRSEDAASTREQLGLDVICLAASHEKPDGATFDSDDPDAVASMIQHVKQAFDHAAAHGAHWSYVVPDAYRDAQTYDRYAAHLPDIAEHAQNLDIKVCIEHFPGTAFPTVASTLEFIRDTAHPNLYLLFDIGHAQMENEDPAQVLAGAGDRLAYVHLDDNDGVNDLHLALTDGVQTRESLTELLGVLEDLGYEGPMSLEIKNDLPDPLDAVMRSYEIIRELIDERD